jgi:flagellar basal-body rod protein FlgB
MRVFDHTLQTLQASLDARLLRQNVLASNVANVDTPAYRPKDVDFGAAMDEALASMKERDEGRSGFVTARQGADPAIIDGEGTTPDGDGNSVDLDKTMAGIAENALQYEAASRAVSKKLAILRYVASDGSV